VTACESSLMSGAALSKRVLVVDDAPAIRDIIARVLRAAGHEVTLAVDGADGLRRFRGDHWDVIITDFQMPNMNGEEMTAAIKAEDPEMVVIMVTGSQGIVQNPGAFHAFIAKPFRRQELLEIVQSAPCRNW